MLPFTPEWRAARDRQQRARRYVAAALAEPDAADVTWLAGAATAGDEDHARWELRYARMAVSTFVAERDALDDRTGSEVAAALRGALESDDRIAADLLPLAERQFADRATGYREAFFSRGGAAGTDQRLGRVLLAFASDGARTGGSPLGRATALLAAYVEAAQAALRDAYGEAHLPDDVAPSKLAGGR